MVHLIVAGARCSVFSPEGVMRPDAPQAKGEEGCVGVLGFVARTEPAGKAPEHRWVRQGRSIGRGTTGSRLQL
jgi:hypothetical protein